MSKCQRRECLRQLTVTFSGVVAVGRGGNTDVLPSPTPASTLTPSGRIPFDLSSPTNPTLAQFSLSFTSRTGYLPASPTLVSCIANLRVTLKNICPDGSLKFAVIAATVALTANTHLTALASTGTAAATPASTSSPLHTPDITASVACGACGTSIWTATDWDTPFQAWVSDPQMFSSIYRKTVGANALVVAWLEVRLFAGMMIEVLPWLENGFLRMAGPTNKAAAFSFTLENGQRFNAALDLPNRCRTPRFAGATLSHWLGVAPQVAIKHDAAYLQATALVPTYRATVPADSTANKALVTNYTLYLKDSDIAHHKAQGMFQSAGGTNKTHGAAWAIRLSLAQAACITPDSDTALRGAFLKENVDWSLARYVAQPNTPFGWVAPYSNYMGVRDGVHFDAAWLQDFYTAAFGYAKATPRAIPSARSQRLTDFFTWKAKRIVGLLRGTKASDYLYADAVRHSIAMASTDLFDFVTKADPWHANWGAICAATLKASKPSVAPGLRGGSFADATSCEDNLQLVIAHAAQHQILRAAEAYQRLTSTANWHQSASGFNAKPVGACSPCWNTR